MIPIIIEPDPNTQGGFVELAEANNSPHVGMCCKTRLTQSGNNRSQSLDLDIWLSQALGRGSGGTVFLADLHVSHESKRQVAVKISTLIITREQRTLLQREIDSWNTLDHPRIVRFLGTCEVGVNQIGLVSEYMKHGNMMQFLETDATAHRPCLLYQVAQGLHYLHVKKEIAHGDLKGENILISDEKCALLTDFGLSTLVQSSGATTIPSIRSRHTPGFAAPEILTDTATNPNGGCGIRSKTIYSDVFAFGVLIYQVYAGKGPWLGEHPDVVYANVTSGKVPEIDLTDPRSVPLPSELDLLRRNCWATGPLDRPMAESLLSYLGPIVDCSEHMSRGTE